MTSVKHKINDNWYEFFLNIILFYASVHSATAPGSSCAFSIFMANTNIGAVLGAITGLCNKKSTGPDDFNAKVIRDIRFSIVK